MLGLLVLFWIAKYYSELAKTYNRNRWGFAILGIATYYGSGILFSVILGLILEFISPGFYESWNTLILSLIIFISGSFCTYSLYNILKNRWKNEFKLQQMAEQFNLD